jgi:exodeoxyribonuclease VII large subunit
MQHGVEERIDALQLRLLRACRYKIALAERRFADVWPVATIVRIRNRLDRARQRVDEQQFRLVGSWQELLHAKAIALQRLHGRVMQQSSFQALRSHAELCATATQRLHRAMQRLLLTAQRAVEALSNGLLQQSPSHRCHRLRQTVDHLGLRSTRAIVTGVERSRATRNALEGRLNALSPLAVLDRGYSLTFTPEGQLVRESSAVIKDEILKTRLARGTVTSTVVHTEDEI